MLKKLLFCLWLLFVIVDVSYASWLSEITGVDINIPAGTVSVNTPKPQAIPQMLQNLPRDVGQALLNPAGAVLATAIRQGAAQARYGAKPIPDNLRSMLAPYFSQNILNKARWNLYDPNRITIDNAITSWFQGEGAVTLDNIVVFSDLSPALSDWKLWAHELTHVMQYDNMGVESFASVYSVNWNSLENQARQWADRVEQGVNSNPQNAQTYFNYASRGNPSYITAQQYTAAARSFYPPAECARTTETPQALWILGLLRIEWVKSGVIRRENSLF